ncbi:hypothetical protein evm_009858 [Chilo suppressalis]|nr:hypothetical protein evm_009858 [Chilo suppressalis]
MTRFWVLVEWLDPSPATVDVLCINPERQDGEVKIAPNQFIVVKSNRGTETRMAQVVEISDNRERLLNRKRRIDANQDQVHCLDSSPDQRSQSPIQEVFIYEEDNEPEVENQEDDNVYGPNSRPSTSGLARGAQSNVGSGILNVPQIVVEDCSNDGSQETQQSNIHIRPIMRAERRAGTNGRNSFNTPQRHQNELDSSRAGPSTMPIRPYPIYARPSNGMLLNVPQGQQPSLHRRERGHPSEHMRTRSAHRERRRRPRLNRSLQNIYHIQQVYGDMTSSEDDEEQANSYRNLLNIPTEQLFRAEEFDVPNVGRNRRSRHNIFNPHRPPHGERQERPNQFTSLTNVSQPEQILAAGVSDDTDNENGINGRPAQQNGSTISQTHQVLIHSSHTIRMDENEVNVENQIGASGSSQFNVSSDQFHRERSSERSRDGSNLPNTSQRQQNVPRSSADQIHTPNQGSSREQVHSHGSTLNISGGQEEYTDGTSSDSELEYYGRGWRSYRRRRPDIRREQLNHYRSLQNISLRPETFIDAAANNIYEQELLDNCRREHFERRRTSRLCRTCGQFLPGYSNRNLVDQGRQEYYDADGEDIQNEFDNNGLRRNRNYLNTSCPNIGEYRNLHYRPHISPFQSRMHQLYAEWSVRDLQNSGNSSTTELFRQSNLIPSERSNETNQTSVSNAIPLSQINAVPLVQSNATITSNQSIAVPLSQFNTIPPNQSNITMQSSQSNIIPPSQSTVPSSQINRERREQSNGRSSLPNTLQRQQSRERDQTNRTIRTHSAHREHRRHQRRNRSLQNNSRRQRAMVEAVRTEEIHNGRYNISNRPGRVHHERRGRPSGRSNIHNTFQGQPNSAQSRRLVSNRSRSAHGERRRQTHRSSRLHNSNQAQQTQVHNSPSRRDNNEDQPHGSEQCQLDMPELGSVYGSGQEPTNENITIETQSRSAYSSGMQNSDNNEQNQRNTNNQSRILREDYQSPGDNRLDISQANEVSEDYDVINNQNQVYRSEYRQSSDLIPSDVIQCDAQQPSNHRSSQQITQEQQNYFASIGLEQLNMFKNANSVHEKLRIEPHGYRNLESTSHKQPCDDEGSSSGKNATQLEKTKSQINVSYIQCYEHGKQTENYENNYMDYTITQDQLIGEGHSQLDVSNHQQTIQSKSQDEGGHNNLSVVVQNQPNNEEDVFIREDQVQASGNRHSQDNQICIERNQLDTYNQPPVINNTQREGNQYGHNSQLMVLQSQAVSQDEDCVIIKDQTQPVNVDEDFQAFEEWAYREHQQNRSNQSNISIQLDPKLGVNQLLDGNSNAMDDSSKQPSYVIENSSDMEDENQTNSNEREHFNISEPIEGQRVEQLIDDGQQLLNNNESGLPDIFKSIFTLQRLFERIQQGFSEQGTVDQNTSRTPVHEAEGSDDTDDQNWLNSGSCVQPNQENILQARNDIAMPSTSRCARAEMVTATRSMDQMNSPMPVKRVKPAHVRRASAQSSVTDDTMVIGSGNARIPDHLLRGINWRSFSTATRQLLVAVFSRRVLATHSLSGKPSRAFTDKPTKKRLNPKLVDEIVKTVSERCGVTSSRVRKIISLKCGEETRLFRKQQEMMRAHQGHRNDRSSDTDVSSGDGPGAIG